MGKRNEAASVVVSLLFGQHGGIEPCKTFGFTTGLALISRNQAASPPQTRKARLAGAKPRGAEEEAAAAEATSAPMCSPPSPRR